MNIFNKRKRIIELETKLSNARRDIFQLKSQIGKLEFQINTPPKFKRGDKVGKFTVLTFCIIEFYFQKEYTYEYKILNMKTNEEKIKTEYQLVKIKEKT